MTKLTLSALANLQNETSAVTAINANNTATAAAMENTLSRNGLAPNQMAAPIDMNGSAILNLNMAGNKILGLGSATSATDAANLGDVSARILNFSALALGSISNTAFPIISAFASPTIAVSTVQGAGGGIIYVPGGVSAPSLPSTYDNVLFQYNGPAAFAGFGYNQLLLRSKSSYAHSDGQGRYVLGIDTNPRGSGTAGPANTEGGLQIINKKQDFLGTPHLGELDGIVIVMQNDGPDVARADPSSDTSGIAVNMTAREKTGFHCLTESVIYEVDSIGAILTTVDIQFGVMSSYTDSANNNNMILYGLCTGNDLNEGLYITATNADRFLRFDTIGGGTRFKVNGDGSMQLYPIDGTHTDSIKLKAVHNASGTGTLQFANSVDSTIATLDAVNSSFTLQGNAAPQVVFSPSTGATKTGNMAQQGDNFIVGAVGVATRLIVSLGSPAIQFTGVGAGTLSTDSSGNLIVTSDSRLKTNVANFTTGLDAAVQLNPVTFNWNEESKLDSSSTTIGFIAQDVQALIPDAVGQTEEGFLTLSDRGILAVLVNAIKELKQQIDELKQG